MGKIQERITGSWKTGMITITPGLNLFWFQTLFFKFQLGTKLGNQWLYQDEPWKVEPMWNRYLRRFSNFVDSIADEKLLHLFSLRVHSISELLQTTYSMYLHCIWHSKAQRILFLHSSFTLYCNNCHFVLVELLVLLYFFLKRWIKSLHYVY